MRRTIPALPILALLLLSLTTCFAQREPLYIVVDGRNLSIVSSTHANVSILSLETIEMETHPFRMVLSFEMGRPFVGKSFDLDVEVRGEGSEDLHRVEISYLARLGGNVSIEERGWVELEIGRFWLIVKNFLYSLRIRGIELNSSINLVSDVSNDIELGLQALGINYVINVTNPVVAVIAGSRSVHLLASIDSIVIDRGRYLWREFGEGGACYELGELGNASLKLSLSSKGSVSSIRLVVEGSKSLYLATEMMCYTKLLLRTVQLLGSVPSNTTLGTWSRFVFQSAPSTTLILGFLGDAVTYFENVVRLGKTLVLEINATEARIVETTNPSNASVGILARLALEKEVGDRGTVEFIATKLLSALEPLSIAKLSKLFDVGNAKIVFLGRNTTSTTTITTTIARRGEAEAISWLELAVIILVAVIVVQSIATFLLLRKVRR